MFTIELGWWLAPSFVTLLAFAWVIEDKNPYTFHLSFLVGVIATLFSWLIWALLT